MKPKTVRDLVSLQAKFRSQATPERLQELAAATCVSVEGWSTIEAGFATETDLRELSAGFATKKSDDYASDEGTDPSVARGDYSTCAWIFPERDGEGRIVGFSLRTPDGRKGSFRDMKRALIVPTTLHDRSGRVLIVEGAKAAASGRPGRPGARPVSRGAFGERRRLRR